MTSELSFIHFFPIILFSAILLCTVDQFDVYNPSSVYSHVSDLQ